MWHIFAFDVVIASLLFLLPGYLINRGFRLSRACSLFFSSAISLLTIYLISFFYLKLNISLEWWGIIFSVLLFSLIVWLVGSVVFDGHKKKTDNSKTGIPEIKQNYKFLLLYILIGAIVSTYIVVKTLDGASSFNQQYDNYSHLSTVRQFLDEGFYTQGNILSYPSAWHCIAALVAGAGFQEVCVAVNAVNFVITSIVFPISVFSLIFFLFGKSQTVLICGSVCSLAFTEFPWGLVLFGPLYPNLLSYAVLPAAMALFVLIFKSENAFNRIKHGALFLISTIALIFMHPNAIFTGIVLLVPFTVAEIYKMTTSTRCLNGKKTLSLGIIVLFLLTVLTIWILLFKSQAFQSVVQFNWPAYLTFWNALANSLLLALTEYSFPQYCLALLVWIGAVYCIVKKTNRWIVVSYGISLIILIVSASTDGWFKHFIAGFWYTDTFRIAAMVALAGIPLASLGLAAVCEMACKLANSSPGAGLKEKIRLIYCLCALTAVIIYFPSTTIAQLGERDTAFGITSKMLTSYNSLSEKAVYSGSEIGFVDEVKDIIGDDAVINIPFDGSFLAYGVNGLNIEYRALETSGYWDESTDISGKLIRANLCNYTMDQDTYNAVKNTDARYVLLLDNEDIAGDRMYPCAKDLSFWQGIVSITDGTPGFEVVLSEGDMRLYRLTEI